jgi:penicillin-insensitive murein endopeptidase
MRCSRQTLGIGGLTAVVLATVVLAFATYPMLGPASQAASAAAKPKKPLVRKAEPPATPAKQLFGAAATPAPLAARSIGFYARGCLAGARPLAIDGPAWQAMRLSRNRYWGHPNLVRLIQRLATDAKAHDGWSGLLVGDLSQPRGGPMLTGHASHQIGLDADIWLTPMPNRRLSEREREEMSATSMLGADGLSVNPQVWSDAQARLIRRAASYPETERIFVHPAIKKALCESAGNDREFLHKVRPYWGHHYHMHIRIACPKGNDNCEAQPALPAGDGCGKELDNWFALLKRPPKPEDKPAKPKPPLTLAQLPTECRIVLEAGAQAQQPKAEPKPATTAVPAATKKQ